MSKVVYLMLTLHGSPILVIPEHSMEVCISDMQDIIKTDLTIPANKDEGIECSVENGEAK